MQGFEKAKLNFKNTERQQIEAYFDQKKQAIFTELSTCLDELEDEGARERCWREYMESKVDESSFMINVSSERKYDLCRLGFNNDPRAILTVVTNLCGVSDEDILQLSLTQITQILGDNPLRDIIAEYRKLLGMTCAEFAEAKESRHKDSIIKKLHELLALAPPPFVAKPRDSRKKTWDRWSYDESVFIDPPSYFTPSSYVEDTVSVVQECECKQIYPGFMPPQTSNDKTISEILFSSDIKKVADDVLVAECMPIFLEEERLKLKELNRFIEHEKKEFEAQRKAKSKSLDEEMSKIIEEKDEILRLYDEKIIIHGLLQEENYRALMIGYLVTFLCLLDDSSIRNELLKKVARCFCDNDYNDCSSAERFSEAVKLRMEEYSNLFENKKMPLFFCYVFSLLGGVKIEKRTIKKRESTFFLRSSRQEQNEGDERVRLFFAAYLLQMASMKKLRERLTADCLSSIGNNLNNRDRFSVYSNVPLWTADYLTSEEKVILCALFACFSLSKNEFFTLEKAVFLQMCSLAGIKKSVKNPISDGVEKSVISQQVR